MKPGGMELLVSGQDIDMVSTVRDLHGMSSQEFSKLFKDAENCLIHYHSRKGLTLKVDIEKLASNLPQHLIAVLIYSERDESLFKYMLSGFRLLYSLCDAAHRHSKLEQVLLDDIKISEQLIDLVFYMLIVLGNCGKEFKSLPVFHSALTASSLNIITTFISSQWQDIVQVLLAHPKVDLFIDASFGAVLMDVKFVQEKLITLFEAFNTSSMSATAKIVSYICQQCEASLQFLLSLSQQKMFRERLLSNKELCGNGGVLFLVQAILKLNISASIHEFPALYSSVSRLKAKILSVLLHLCEAENISYLDEVASSPRCFNLAKSVALEVLEVLKSAVINSSKCGSNVVAEHVMPMGLLQLNALRLADIFSDDSNFRSYITANFTKVLASIFSLPHGDFVSIWCSSDLPSREEDASLEYDTFSSAGWILDAYSRISSPDIAEMGNSLIPTSMPQATYAHQRTALFVKVIANLHCFVPNICEEQERNLFLHKFIECMQTDPSESLPGCSFTTGSTIAATVCKNLRSLLRHAESLIPNFLNEEDVQLLRVFFSQLRALMNPSDLVEVMAQEENLDLLENYGQTYKKGQLQESQDLGRYMSPMPRDQLDCSNKFSNQNEELSDAVVFHGESSSKCMGTHHMDQSVDPLDTKDIAGGNLCDDSERIFHNAEISGAGSSSSKIDIKESGYRGGNDDEKGDTTQFEDKQPRKRKRTIMNEHQMTLVERALLVEPDMQRHAASLQSWARKLSNHGSEVTSLQLKNWLNNRKARLARAARNSEESPDSHGDDVALPESSQPLDFSQCIPGQSVALLDAQGDEIGKGKLHQIQGKWYGKSLDEMGIFVVDVSELKIESYATLPYPSEATGTSFSEAKIKVGAMRVLWSPDKLLFLDRDFNSS